MDINLFNVPIADGGFSKREAEQEATKNTATEKALLTDMNICPVNKL